MAEEKDDLTVVYLWAMREAAGEIRPLKKENKALKAENERLREVLRLYACAEECANCYGPVQDTKYCGKTARAALGEEK